MKKIAQGGLLVAVALVLSLIEKMFPLQAVVPIPGIKLGLANVVTLFALTVLGTRQAVVIVLCRVTLAAIFMGSITGFLFSLFGGLLALFVMRALLLREGTWFSLVGVSIGGAAAHNIGQIFAAMLTLGTVDVAGYLPLLLSAIPMGFVTG
ncbi:MAG: Gx transporter family protein, partial [Butyricicoccus sp.]